jgi:hypothetical protein
MWDDVIFDPEKIQLLDFKLLKGQVETPEDFDEEKLNGFDLDNTLKLGFNLGEKLAKVDLKIRITANSTSVSVAAFTLFEMAFIFQTANLDELAMLDDSQALMLHPALGNSLAAIAYSTARGVLLTRLQGTIFQDFILPVVSSTKLLMSDSQVVNK